MAFFNIFASDRDSAEIHDLVSVIIVGYYIWNSAYSNKTLQNADKALHFADFTLPEPANVLSSNSIKRRRSFSRMRRYVGLIIILGLILGLCACGGNPGQKNAASEETQQVSGESPEPADTPNCSPEIGVDSEWAEIFFDFLKENYNGLMDASGLGFAGVGFIDLDLDGDAELLLFDSGASASMGVQFFDIIDGEVVCVSANLLAVGEAFGNGLISDVYVNANYFEDFRLLQAPDGSRFFTVQSFNGAMDFSYNELIRFGCEDGILTLDSLLYKYEEYDDESGKIVSVKCSAGDSEITPDEYYTRFDGFSKENADTGFEAGGAFIWEDKDFAGGYDGFLAMAEAALALYVPACK